MKQIILKRGKEESLLRYHPWVFSGAIHHAEGNISEGDVVRVCDANGDFIATGHYQQGSIAVRVLSFEDVSIDDAFWHHRLSEALKVRQRIGLATQPSTIHHPLGSAASLVEEPSTINHQPSTLHHQPSTTTAYRLVHGEGDQMPGLIIDIYGSMAVMQAHSIGMHLARHAIAQQLVDVMQGAVSSVYYKSEGTLSFMDPEKGFIIGSEGDNIALENGLRLCRLAARTEDRLLRRPARQPCPAGAVCLWTPCAEYVLLHGRLLFLCHARWRRAGAQR